VNKIIKLENKLENETRVREESEGYNRKEKHLTNTVELTCSYKDGRVSDGRRGDVANFASANSQKLGKENSLVLEVIIQSHQVVAHVHHWIRGAVIQRI